jgi:hypothetical protein
LAAFVFALGIEPGPAEDLPETPSLTNIRRQGVIQFALNSGRIAVTASRTYSSSHAGPMINQRGERLSIRVANNEPVVAYELATPAYCFLFDVAAGNRIQLRRLPKGDQPGGVPVAFTQAPNEPVTLKVGPKESERVYRAASIWHLLIAEPAAAREHLVPLLRILLREWDFVKTTVEIESTLVRTAQSGGPPDQKLWAQWVQQLADASFATRESADRKLRETGRVVVSYLQQLDPARLDAEQRFRVRRILRALSDMSNEESPPQLAVWLSGDTSIWLALLARDDEATRRAALKRLETILGRPLAFDPAADPKKRQRQLEALRAGIAAK